MKLQRKIICRFDSGLTLMPCSGKEIGVHEAVNQDYFLIHHPCKMFDQKIPTWALS